jgi:hypothetical protein
MEITWVDKTIIGAAIMALATFAWHYHRKTDAKNEKMFNLVFEKFDKLIEVIGSLATSIGKHEQRLTFGDQQFIEMKEKISKLDEHIRELQVLTASQGSKPYDCS